MCHRANTCIMYTRIIDSILTPFQGLYWALACIWLLNPGVKIPHIKGEAYTGNSSYTPLYHDYLPIEFAVNGKITFKIRINKINLYISINN